MTSRKWWRVDLVGALVVAAFIASSLNRSLARGLDVLVEGAARVAGVRTPR